MGRSLGKAFGASIRFLPDLIDARDPAADLAVGVSTIGDEDGQRAFAAWAQNAGVPALGVVLGIGEALIGPLALPGRAGCGRCAWERRIAASVSDRPIAGTADSLQEAAAVAGPVLARDIRAVLRRGPEASRLLDHVLAIDAEAHEWSLHRVIPLARCAVCGGAAAFPRENRHIIPLSPEDSVEHVLEALAGWVDPRTGVISRLVVEPDETGVDLMVATAAPPHVVDEDGSLLCLPIGWGKGFSVSGAILSAVGEAIERYAPSLPDRARIRWERPDDLEGEVLDPRTFALYTDAQYESKGFPFARFDPEVRHPWVLGRWLGSDAPVWVPAVLAFMSLTLWPEHLICQGTSNGLAAATDPEDAALRATLELVERDAFMASWLTASPGRRVELDDNSRLRRVLDGIEALGATVELYVLRTSACGTTALCLAFGDGDRYPGVTIGLGADLDPRSAFRQAILELGQTGPHLRRMMHSNAVPVPDDPELVREMLDHAAYYFPAERAAAFDALRRDTEAPLALTAEGAPERSLASCASALDSAGVRVALVDVTSPDVATGPFHVMRAVSPDLQSISFGYGLDRRPVERVRFRGLAAGIPPIHPIW